MAEFSEQILWRDGSKKSHLEDRWHKGVYLGPCFWTSDSLVGTTEGTVVKARTCLLYTSDAADDTPCVDL
eukprot:3069615-Amphidinium_carterae.1